MILYIISNHSITIWILSQCTGGAEAPEQREAIEIFDRRLSCFRTLVNLSSTMVDGAIAPATAWVIQCHLGRWALLVPLGSGSQADHLRRSTQ